MSPFVHLILCQRLWCPVASPEGHVVGGDPLCATGVEWEKTPSDKRHAARTGAFSAFLPQGQEGCGGLCATSRPRT